MSGNRTEAPTPRRLREARRRGEVATSRELTGAAALLAGAVTLAALASSTWDLLQAQVQRGLAAALSADAVPSAALADALRSAARALLPPALAALAAAAAAGALQAGLFFSSDAVAPKLERLDPSRGLGRLFSPARLGAIGLGLAKVTLAAWLGLHHLRAASGPLAALPRLHALSAAAAILPVLRALALQGMGVLALFGLVDWALSRRRHLRALRMTRDEVRREQREDEGDPAVRAERRRAHEAALAAPISKAACVVVNPTHIAVALFHRRASEDAPVVVAKGSGPEAARIRGEARRAGVPIVRDVALARALFRLSVIGDEIPEELYEAAAAVLAHVYGTLEEGT